MTRVLRFTLPIVLTLLATSPALAIQLRSSVFGSGASPAAGIAGGGRTLRGTAAQPAIGLTVDGGRALRHGFWRPLVATPLAVDPITPGAAVPRRVEFAAPRPNPSRGDVQLAFGLPRPATVCLAVHDVQGRLVDTIVREPLSAGRYSATWTSSAAAGVYFARLTVDGRVMAERRVVRTR